MLVYYSKWARSVALILSLISRPVDRDLYLSLQVGVHTGALVGLQLDAAGACTGGGGGGGGFLPLLLLLPLLPLLSLYLLFLLLPLLSLYLLPLPLCLLFLLSLLKLLL